MDALQFDRLARLLSKGAARRTITHGIAPAVFGLIAFGSSDEAKARENKLERNAFGCVDVGLPCRGRDANCCSGMCDGKKPKRGKKDKSLCVAHHVLNCPAGADVCSGTGEFCGFAFNGDCVQTTGQATFCGLNAVCSDCRKDTDCESTAGPGAACIVCATLCPTAPHTACIRASAA
jgi:hypothetical protein